MIQLISVLSIIGGVLTGVGFTLVFIIALGYRNTTTNTKLSFFLGLAIYLAALVFSGFLIKSGVDLGKYKKASRFSYIILSIVLLAFLGQQYNMGQYALVGTDVSPFLVCVVLLINVYLWIKRAKFTQ